ADFDPVHGEEWGVLISASTGSMFPFCGRLVLFERTEKSEAVFARVEKELAAFPETAGLKLPERIEIGRGHSADGLFSPEQISRYDRFLVNNPFWTALGQITFQEWERFVPDTPGSLLLDLGCGTGRCAAHFVK